MYEIDKLASVHNHDKMGFDRRIRFCPSCGLRRLHRTDRELDPMGKEIQGREMWCSLCGFSFNIRASIEWNLALRLFRDHRKMRSMNHFLESNANPEAMRNWKIKFDRPTFTPSSTWNLGDKLKAALGI